MNTVLQLEPQTYLFRFTGEPANAPCQLVSLGWEKPVADYHWDNLVRKRGDLATYSFQYTLSGQGILEWGGEPYTLTQHQAFFLEFPGSHTYYLPHDSTHWEFIYVQLKGPLAERTYQMVREALGVTFNFGPDSEPILSLRRLLRQAQEKKISNGYMGSKLTYDFLMELQCCLKASPNSPALPLPILTAVEFIADHYSEVIGIQDIARQTSLTKYYFDYLFHESTGRTPLQYLTAFRIKRAVELLNTTQLPVYEISKRVGYPNCNYFCKLFKSIVGCTPTQLRERPFDQLIFES